MRYWSEVPRDTVMTLVRSDLAWGHSEGQPWVAKGDSRPASVIGHFSASHTMITCQHPSGHPEPFPPTAFTQWDLHSIMTVGGDRTPPFQVPPSLRATQDRKGRGNMCQNSRFGVLNVASLGPPLPTTILTQWLTSVVDSVSSKEQRCTFLGSVPDPLHKPYYCLLLSTAKKSVLCVLDPSRLTNFMHHSYPLRHFFNLRQMEVKSSVHTAVLNNTWWPQTAP